MNRIKDIRTVNKQPCCPFGFRIKLWCHGHGWRKCYDVRVEIPLKISGETLPRGKNADAGVANDSYPLSYRVENDGLIRSRLGQDVNDRANIRRRRNTKERPRKNAVKLRGVWKERKQRLAYWTENYPSQLRWQSRRWWWWWDKWCHWYQFS